MIVRLFEPAPGTGRVALRGLVEDVRTGACSPFDGGEELLGALARAVDLGEEPPGAPGGAEQGRKQGLEQNCWS